MENADLRLTLMQWRNGLHIGHAGHARAASGAERSRRRLGVPAVVLATLSGGAGLSTISGTASHTLAVVSGAAGVAAAILVGLQTFLGHEKLAAEHEKAAAEYGDLRRRLEMLLAGELDEVTLEMSAIRERWYELDLRTPTVPRAIHDSVKKTIRPAQLSTGPAK